jgi:L-seryl-tRNA(Ser) seleniumtransferase
MPDGRRRLPSVDSLLRSEPGRRASGMLGRPVVRRAIRSVLDDARRAAARGGAPPERDAILARAAALAARMSFGLSPVINATGVVLHTNLGRAPLPKAAVRAVGRAARGYTDLEVDREPGTRGRRTSRAEFLLAALTGAEDALVVNNNAAALLLAMAALARRKDVLVSRGELIEIGGEFRLPEIMRASGARLVEVGTTNRTRLGDYRAAMTERTGMILKVHPSNYRVVGFAESPSVSSLAGLAGRGGVPLMYDTGSGLLEPVREVPGEEPAATEALAEGADLVCFSGDKLLGGPQAGVVLGRADLVARLRRHPIARAVRVDKLTVAALEAVLTMYAQGRRGEVPVWRALAERPAALRARARALVGSIPSASVAAGESVAGGGSIPGYGIPSAVIRLPDERPDRLATRLRSGTPPVFCRVDEEALVFDLRTVEPEDDELLARAIRYAREET